MIYNIQKPDISVIVPMYNVEEFLPRCVESIINQTHKNIEIILVDDGSPDKSGEIADEYANKDERISVIHQDNKWLGGARNSGLKVAKGKYVLFVDSDDYIRQDMCELLYNKIEEDGVDAVFFGLTPVNENGVILSSGLLPLTINKVYRGNEVQETLYPLIISTHSLNSAVMKIYRRDFLVNNDLLFDESVRYAEDYVFCLDLFPRLKSFSYLNEPLYYYVENNSSIMHARDAAIINKLITLYEYRERFLEKNDLITDENKRLSCELLTKMVVVNLPKYLGVGNNTTYREKMKLIKDLCNNQTIQYAVSNIDTLNMDLGRYGISVIYSIRRKLYYSIYVLFNIHTNLKRKV